MKKSTKFLTLLLSLFLLIGTTQISAKQNIGIGVIIGNPTGLSLKFDNFPVMGIAWNTAGYLHVHADYWLINKTLADPINWYLGLGGKVIFWTDHRSSNLGLGIRIPVGLQWFPFNNLELFGEIVPGLALFPATGFDWDAGIGARFYLN